MTAFTAKVAAARAAAGLSRRTRAGGGTTLPGKLLLRMAPDAIERMTARLSDGSVAISATNGKTTTAKMLAALLEPERRLCRNTAGANLESGVASALLHCEGADLGVFEVDEATEIETRDHGTMTVAELERLMRARRDDRAALRCSGTFHDPTRVRTDSHLINWGRHGLGIWDSMTETTWHRRERAPSARFEFLGQLLAMNPFTKE